MIPKAICLLAALNLAALPTSAPAGDQFDEVRDLIREQMTKENIPSVAVAVAQHGKIQWEEGFGWADKEGLIPATPNTMYRIASITKPLTTTALMRLVQSGKIDLDRPVNDYLGNVKLIARIGDTKDATVRRIANHTAGLPQHWQYFYSNENCPVPSLEETLLHYGNIVTPPGEKYIYSNLDYAVLSEVIARVSGQSYEEYMRANVFVPLGMTHTSVSPDLGMQPFIAVSYDQSGSRIPAFKVDYPGGAAGYSSAHDLVRFGQFHLKDHLPDQRRILSDENISEMQRATAQSPPYGSNGIGWYLENDRPVVEHGGYFPGASALLRLVPSADAVVVVLTNSNQSDQQPTEYQIADRVLRILIGDWKPPVHRTANQASRATFQASPALIGKWEGILHTYRSDLPLTFEFLSTGEFARAQLGDQPKTTLGNILFNPTNGALNGDMHGSLDTPDANRLRPYLLRFNLKVIGDMIKGTARTWYYENSNGFCLSEWVELKKR